MASRYGGLKGWHILLNYMTIIWIWPWLSAARAYGKLWVLPRKVTLQLFTIIRFVLTI